MMDILKRLMAGLCVAWLVTLTGGPMLPVQMAAAQGGCTELIRDGGFEAGDAWQLGATPLMPEYVTYTKHGGDKSLVLGITRGGGKAGFSSAKQTVTIPTGATKVTLSFWYNAMVEGFPRADAMQLVLLNPDGSVLATPWKASNDSRSWNQLTVDLLRWRGRTVQVYFNVYNDGTPNTAGMFLDDVSLVSCPGAATPGPTATRMATPTATMPWPIQTPSRTPTASPTPTASLTPWPTATATETPLPAHCSQIVENSSFELDLAPWWDVYPSPLLAQRVTSPVRSDAWALRLGTQWDNYDAASAVRQVVTIPPGIQRATLRFYFWTWAETGAGADRQEARLFAADGTLLDTYLYELSNNRSWYMQEADLTRFAGQMVQLLFNVYNDGLGGRTAMFLDDVTLVVCSPNATAPAARVATGSLPPWPNLRQLAPPTGPVSSGFRAGAGAAAQAAPPSAAVLETTRTALALTPAPSATVGSLPTIAPAATTTTERGRTPPATAGQVLATWQSRWWVVVIALGLLALLALALRR